jgi:hypothetical protein
LKVKDLPWEKVQDLVQQLPAKEKVELQLKAPAVGQQQLKVKEDPQLVKVQDPAQQLQEMVEVQMLVEWVQDLPQSKVVEAPQEKAQVPAQQVVVMLAQVEKEVDQQLLMELEVLRVKALAQVQLLVMVVLPRHLEKVVVLPQLMVQDLPKVQDLVLELLLVETVAPHRHLVKAVVQQLLAETEGQPKDLVQEADLHQQMEVQHRLQAKEVDQPPYQDQVPHKVQGQAVDLLILVDLVQPHPQALLEESLLVAEQDVREDAKLANAREWLLSHTCHLLVEGVTPTKQRNAMLLVTTVSVFRDSTSSAYE